MKIKIFLVMFFASHSQILSDVASTVPVSTPQKSEPSFVVVSPKPKQSKNVHKENLGEELKNLHAECCALNKLLARIQYRIAQLQNKVVQQGQALFDNQPPFKKASKNDLHAATSILHKTTKTVAAISSTLESQVQSLKKNPCMKKCS